MAEAQLTVRPFQPADKKQVLFAIGMTNMEDLTVANRLVYRNPITLTVWVALSCMFIEHMKWWPDHSRDFLAYLNMVYPFASMAAIVLLSVNWIHRPYFERRTEGVLRRQPEMLDLLSYYSHPKSSGLWILEYRAQFIGLIAVDASQLANDDPNSGSQGASSVATIRHFYVDRLYRAADVQSVLLVHAVRHAFSSDDRVECIRAPDSPLKPYARDALRRVGFKLEKSTEKVGLLRWELGTSVLSREQWEKSSRT